MKSMILALTTLLTLSASMSVQTRGRVGPPRPANTTVKLQADLVYRPEIMARGTFLEALKATAQSVTLSEDSANEITLAGTGPTGRALTYQIVTKPSHGTLSGRGALQRYLPDANYNGGDRFFFRVSDGINTSPVATVLITVTAINDPPIQTAGGANETTSTGNLGELMFPQLKMSPGGGPDEASQTITCKFISLPPSTHSVIYRNPNKSNPVNTGMTLSWSQFKDLFLSKAQVTSVGSHTRHFQCTDSEGASSAEIAYIATVN